MAPTSNSPTQPLAETPENLKKPEPKTIENKKDVTPPKTLNKKTDTSLMLGNDINYNSDSGKDLGFGVIDYMVHVFKIEKGKLKPSIVATGEDKNNYLSPKELREKLGAKLVTNGGYFLDSSKPNIQEGLLILDGKKIADVSTNPKLSGILTIQENIFNIIETKKFKIEDLSADASAIQIGPRLVEHGGINGIAKPDLTTTADKRLARTAICIMPNQDTLILVTDLKSGLYLYEMAEVARTQGCDMALNLDGGPATSISVKDYEGTNFKGLEIPAQSGWVHPNLIVIE